MTELCAGLAAKRGVARFGEDDPFPLPATIVRDLSPAYVARVFDSADENARKMSNLVAIALHGHDAGMEYLSTFTSAWNFPNKTGLTHWPTEGSKNADGMVEWWNLI
jgi:hypothetical protein